MVRTLLFVFMLVVVGGCASLPQDIIGTTDLTEAEIEAKGAKIIEVYLATTRAPDDDPAILYSRDRNSELNFSRVSVSIPPNHQLGNIERPRRRVPNPRTEFAILDPVDFPSPDAFVRSVDGALSKKPADEHDVLIFVHGYNTDLTSAILRTAQFASDIDYPGVPVLFSWASSGRTIDYLYDLNSALHARDSLLEAGRVLSKTKANGFNVMAHSMGTLLTVEAMRQAVLMSGGRPPSGFRVKGVALASPDIDIDLFRRQLDVLPTDRIPIYLLTSTDDRALALSGRIAGGRRRVGAADVDELSDLGVIVIDLSAVDDRDATSHTKFANAPDVIKVLGAGLRAGNSLETRTDDGFRLRDRLGLGGRVSRSGRVITFD